MQKFILFLLALLLLAGCTGSTVATPAGQLSSQPVQENPASAAPAPGGVTWPTGDWQTGTPESQKIDGALLKKMQAEIKSKGPVLDSLIIIRNGVIVSETYYNGSKPSDLHVQYSVTKSFLSTLVGIAFDQSKLRIEQRIGEFFSVDDSANPDPRKEVMTVENLLTMTSGLDWLEGDSSYNALYRSQDWVKWMLDLPAVAAPGETFKYCSGCSHLLLEVLQKSIDGDAEDFADQNLFAPLGIKNYRWERNPQGDLIGGWGLYLTPRDMAKLGYLYLHDGRWEDRQVVSSSWVQAATVKRMETDGNLGYGYQWWTYPTHNAYTALGRGGQTIFVIPDLNMIVVTTADLSSGHDPIFHLIDTYIIPAVVD